MKSLSSILNVVSGVIVIRGDIHREVRSIRYDSRKVEPGDLFVAVNGPDDKALGFVDDAIDRGATSVLLDDPVHMPRRSGDTAFVLVRDARKAMAEASAAMFDYPADGLEIYGVTGTNGKTTVAHVFRDLFREAGEKVGMIGTFGWTVDKTVPTGYTTPESPELMSILAQMRDVGVRKVIMEVSSHALALDRVAGIDFAGAILTNITQDHLDFHSSFQEYYDAKKRLFDQLDGASVALVNDDDIHGRGMAGDSDATVIRYGRGESADLRIVEPHLGPDGTRWILECPKRFGGGRIALSSSLIGGFNLSNLTAACGLALAAGIGRDALPDLVARVEPVPGRMETIALGNGATAVVDYAHTPDALENLLTTVREFVRGGHLNLVFGCGGDRDRTKRPIMGEIAARHSDRIVVTSDNPRTEDPEGIIAEICEGIGEGTATIERISDRRAGIEAALEMTGPNDVLVVAGKGHETYQTVGHDRLPFDDRSVIRGWIGQRTGN